jgi:hypothetical protein
LRKSSTNGKVWNHESQSKKCPNIWLEKDLIGMYVSENEGANFWLSVLTDLKSRGLKDILYQTLV